VRRLVPVLIGLLMARHAFRKALGSRGRRRAWCLLGAQLADDVKLSARVAMRRPEHVSIGPGSRLDGRIWIDSWGQVAIGANVQMNGDIDLYTGSHDINSPHLLAGDIRPIEIGDYAWLAHRIIVLPGRKVGRCAVIGSGAVVAHDIPDYGVAAGNPARVVKERARVDFTYRPSEF
jgi:serine acetyltransferase